MDAESRVTVVAEAPAKTSELTGNPSRTYKFIKRAFDIAASAVVTAICLIPLAVIAAMIVIKDPGSPFYVHRRVGMDGKEISVLKFRTMRRGADALEDMLTPKQMEEYRREYKLHDDPRLIGYKKPGDGERCFGALLRRTSLDELPQVFYNVLFKGDMSFVGPRPVLREELEKYYGPAEQEMLLSVKPGVTGYWQTHGRNDSTYETGERQRLELYYVNNQSICLDIKILFKTVSVVVHRGGDLLKRNVLVTRTVRPSIKLSRILKTALCLPFLLTVPVVETGESTEAPVPIQKTGPGIAYRFIKRAFDIAASAAGLVVVSPILLVAVIAIVLEDGASPFFLQPRIGKDCKSFQMVKLRSMRPNAEQMLAQMTDEEKEEFSKNFKLKNDPRITKVGQFIRRTSIDELPQLWNVLRGDMSIVGPRPPLLMEEEAYGRHLATVMSVRPGITGYWQVHGRSETDFSERIALNEYYLEHRSMGMDMKILFETVKVVLTGKGAQ